MNPACRLGAARTALLIALALAWNVAPASAAGNEPISPVAASLKSAFLLNFARFVAPVAEKEEAADAPYDVCVLAPDTLGVAIDESLRGKQVRGHAVRVRRGERADELRDCQLVYLGVRGNELLEDQLRRLSGHGVLTVHEAESARSGGVVRLFIEGNRQRFEINLAAAEREGLQASAGLLELAQRVRQ